MASEKKQIHTRINGDKQARFEQFMNDRDLKVADATRELIEDGLRVRGYHDEPTATARIFAEFGKALLYLAGSGLVITLVTGVDIVPGSVDAGPAAVLVLFLSAISFGLAARARRQQWTPRTRIRGWLE